MIEEHYHHCPTCGAAYCCIRHLSLFTLFAGCTAFCRHGMDICPTCPSPPCRDCTPTF